jgi:hypothetical protein
MTKKGGIYSVLDKRKLYSLIGKPTGQKPHENCRRAWDDISSTDPEEIENKSAE